MRRRCDGNDPNLVMDVDALTGKRIEDEPTVDILGGDAKRRTQKPCDCGRVFDDVYHSTIYPHSAI